MRTAFGVIGLAVALAGCATGPTSFPVQATRFHYDAVADRGTVRVEPLPGGSTPSIEYKTYAAAVEAELLRLGFTSPAAGATPQYLATVSYTRALRPLPPKRSPIQIGIGGGGYSGGWRGGTSLGGGVSFPVGGGGAREGVATLLTVTIRRGADTIWEGRAQTVTDVSRPDATSAAVAQRLATALFTGFPGESGRTINVP